MSHPTDMKFLIVDDFSTMRRIVRAAKDGAAGYIVKPFTKATLEEKVQKIMQKLAATA